MRIFILDHYMVFTLGVIIYFCTSIVLAEIVDIRYKINITENILFVSIFMRIKIVRIILFWFKLYFLYLIFM